MDNIVIWFRELNWDMIIGLLGSVGLSNVIMLVWFKVNLSKVYHIRDNSYLSNVETLGYKRLLRDNNLLRNELSELKREIIELRAIIKERL